MKQEETTGKGKRRTVWVVAALLLILVGIMIMAIAGYWIRANHRRWAETVPETREFVIEEGVRNLNITTVDYDIQIAAGQEKEGLLEYTYWKDYPLMVEVQGDTLYIKEKKKNRWFDFIQFGFFRDFQEGIIGRERTMVLRLSPSLADKLAVETVTGNLSAKDLYFSVLDFSAVSGDIDARGLKGPDISVTAVSGKVELEDVEGRAFYSSVVSGDLTLRDAVFEESMDISAVSGNVRLHESDAPDIRVETVSGDIEGEILTDKQFRVQSLAGDVDVPNSFGDDDFRAETVSGNVEIEVVQKAE